MADIKKQRERLIELLRELFQLNQPDLDFGLYRIMHAKADQVSKFLDEDLLSIIGEAFGESNETLVAKAKTAYEAAIQQAKDFGAPDPEATQPVQEAKNALIAAKDTGSSEEDVYDHLYRFFERYYDNGDFMSLRYFTRETDGKASPYAVPYDGKEVYLHWANRDQYYIKTSEYLTNFTFDPTLAKEFNGKHKELFEGKPLKVHFRVVSAGEGEHNNIKAAEQNKRYFIIHKDEPLKLEIDESGETNLVIQFAYRADPEKSGQERAWRKKRLEEAATVIKEALSELSGGDNFAKVLLAPAPTDKEKSRTLLEKYLFQYTARNTMDYFIHKDLGGFLRRELDFYIKNEILHLDDIESAKTSRTDFENYLTKIKVLRATARRLIDFLAQIENFQKKLWLKKKLVVETNYCVTLDKVPESLYTEIGRNNQQIQEWKKLFAIDDMEDCGETLGREFLKNNTYLVLDTAFFSEDFKCRILSTFENIDEHTDGLLIHSENFQALNLLQEKYEERVKCIYIDPPYNSPSSEILYKNNYKHSAWMTLISDRISVSKTMSAKDGALIVAIDENENDNLSLLLKYIYSSELFDINTISVCHNPKGIQGGFVSINNDYALTVSPKNIKSNTKKIEKKDWKYENFRNWGGESERKTAKNCFYPIYVRGNEIVDFGEVCKKDYHPEFNERAEGKTIAVYPIDKNGVERKWTYARDSVERIRHLLRVKKLSDGRVDIEKCRDKERYKTTWLGSKHIAGDYGSKILNNIIGEKKFDFPKSIHTVEDFIRLIENNTSLVLDYFAGSGTTGHAAINLNREDNGRRKYILVEMGEYFDTVLKPRIQKVIYSKDWNDGKPVSREGSSHCFKYIRLESYEDALNNLTLKPSPNLESADSRFARDYMLRYWLDIETKGSPSLLNIKDFDDPTAYTLKVKKPGTDEYAEKAVDLVETFNWLVGLHVERLDRWRGYGAAFKREKDPELPEDGYERLVLNGSLKEADDGAWRLRRVEGYRFRAPGNHSDRERVLVIWRKLTGDMEQDNLVLDGWFKEHRLSNSDSAFDIIYVNGSNNLPRLRQAGEAWKVHLIEEMFHQAMWDVED